MNVYLKKLLTKYGLLFLLFIFSFFVLFLNLNKPFVGHHDFMSAYSGMIAKNYVKFGVWNLKFGQVTTHVKGEISEIKSFHVSYLPLLTLLIALSFSIFGVVEWAERLVPAFFSLVGVLVFYLLIARIWSKKIALFCAIFYIFNPMYIYFGSLPAPEPVVLSLVIVSFYFFYLHLESQKRSYFYFSLLFLFFGGLAGWPAVYAVPLILIYSLYFKKFKKKFFSFLIILFIIPALQFLHLYILTGQFGGMLFETFKNRFSSNDLSFGGTDFSIFNYIKQEVAWLQVYFTRVLIFLSIIYLLSLLKKINRINEKEGVVLFFLFFGLAHQLLFSRYVFIHDFLNIYLLPFFALAGGLGVGLIISSLLKIKMKKSSIVFISFFIFLIFIFERIEYTKALLSTKMNQPGLEMANILNQINIGDKSVAISSPRFASFYGIFTNFYVNHAYDIVDENNLKNTDFPNKYDYLIMIDEDIANRDFYEELISKYKSEKIDDKTIINFK